MKIVDVWERLRPIFEGDNTVQIEIELGNIALDDLVNCLLYMMRHSRDVNSQFVLAGTKIVTRLPSPLSVAHNVIDGRVSASMWFEFFSMPPIGLYVDAADTVNLAFIPGASWNAMSLLVLFDFLDRVRLMAPSVKIRLNPYTATRDEQALFMEIWRDYDNAPT